MPDNEETVTSTRRIYDGKIINLRVDTVILPGGKTAQREIVEHRGAVAIVPLKGRDTVVLVRQHRTPAEAALLEIPAGTREPDEDIELCARRELGEEIGMAAGRMVKLFHSYMAPGYSTEVIHTFLALDLAPAHGFHADEDENLEVVEISLADALAQIRSGGIVDAKSISGLLFVDRILPGLEL